MCEEEKKIKKMLPLRPLQLAIVCARIQVEELLPFAIRFLYSGCEFNAVQGKAKRKTEREKKGRNGQTFQAILVWVLNKNKRMERGRMRLTS